MALWCANLTPQQQQLDPCSRHQLNTHKPAHPGARAHTFERRDFALKGRGLGRSGTGVGELSLSLGHRRLCRAQLLLRRAQLRLEGGNLGVKVGQPGGGAGAGVAGSALGSVGACLRRAQLALQLGDGRRAGPRRRLCLALRVGKRLLLLEELRPKVGDLRLRGRVGREGGVCWGGGGE